MDVNLLLYESFLAFPVPASLKPQGKKIHFSVKTSCSSRSLTAALGPCWAGAAAGVLSQARSKPSGVAVGPEQPQGRSWGKKISWHRGLAGCAGRCQEGKWLEITTTCEENAWSQIYLCGFD